MLLKFNSILECNGKFRGFLLSSFFQKGRPVWNLNRKGAGYHLLCALTVKSLTGDAKRRTSRGRFTIVLVRVYINSALRT